MGLGTSYNGHITARSTVGAGSILTGAALSAYISTSQWSGWAVANVTNIPNDEGAPPDHFHVYNAGQLFCDTNASWGAAARTGGTPGPSFSSYNFNAIYLGPEIPMTANVLALYQIRSQVSPGVGTQIRINGGAWSSPNGTPPAGLTGILHVASNFTGGVTLGADFANIALSPDYFDDATFDGVLSSMRARYKQPFA